MQTIQPLTLVINQNFSFMVEDINRLHPNDVNMCY